MNANQYEIYNSYQDTSFGLVDGEPAFGSMCVTTIYPSVEGATLSSEMATEIVAIHVGRGSDVVVFEGWTLGFNPDVWACPHDVEFN